MIVKLRFSFKMLRMKQKILMPSDYVMNYPEILFEEDGEEVIVKPKVLCW